MMVIIKYIFVPLKIAESILKIGIGVKLQLNLAPSGRITCKTSRATACMFFLLGKVVLLRKQRRAPLVQIEKGHNKIFA